MKTGILYVASALAGTIPSMSSSERVQAYSAS